ncbi:MAG: hypothetical protein Q4E75_00990 [bacterium]|nr:hypothetical protein [bacterium]
MIRTFADTKFGSPCKEINVPLKEYLKQVHTFLNEFNQSIDADENVWGMRNNQYFLNFLAFDEFYSSFFNSYHSHISHDELENIVNNFEDYYEIKRLVKRK